MSDIVLFENSEFGKVRFLEIENNIYAVGKDVAEVLGYKEPHKAISRHCKGSMKHPIVDVTGFEQQMNIIPECDIYRLIMRSNMSRAEKFQDWVMEDVLPSIRKNGMYAKDELLDNPEMLLDIVTKLVEERKKVNKLKLENKMKDQVIAEYEPKVTYYDTILQSTGVVTITQIAKDYSLSGRALNSILLEEGIQYKQNGQWLLKQKYVQGGYTKSRTYNDAKGRAIMHTYWTQKGRLLIHNLLEERNIVAVMDME